MEDGDVIDPEERRCWESHDDDSQMRCYLGVKGRITLGELIDHFADKYPHVELRCLELNFATVVWQEPPTAEDLAQREKAARWKAQRQERWERETYDRLKAKFET